MLCLNYNEPLFSIIFLIPWFCGMSCSLNEWATAPDCMKSGKHVSTLLDKNPSLHVRPSVPAPRNEAAVPHWPHILPNLFPRPLEHTHICTDRHTARFHLHSETRRLFPTHPTCFGARPSLRSVTTGWKARRWRGSSFCGNSCWQEFFEVTQNFLDLRFWTEKRNRILSCYSRLRV